MWYTTKVGPDVANAAREFAVHMSHPGTEHWKALGRFIVSLKGEKIIGIIIRKPKVLKAVMFCDSNYATDKETRKTVSGLVATLGGKNTNVFVENSENCDAKQHKSKVHSTVSMCTRGKIYKYVAWINDRSGKLSVIYKDNQGGIFLAKNRQVVIRKNHIYICHHFLRDMMEDKDVDIQYIRSEEKPADIITKKTLEEYFASHMRKITEG